MLLIGFWNSHQFFTWFFKIETQILVMVVRITAFGNFLSDLRTDRAYHHFFQSTVYLTGEPSNADKRHNCKSLYFAVVDNIMSRFADCRNFAFLDLVNPCIFTQWKKECYQICSNH